MPERALLVLAIILLCFSGIVLIIGGVNLGSLLGVLVGAFLIIAVPFGLIFLWANWR